MGGEEGRPSVELECRRERKMDAEASAEEQMKAMEQTVAKLYDASDRWAATLAKREELLVRIWRKERAAFAELDYLVTLTTPDGKPHPEGLGMTLEELTRPRARASTSRTDTEP